MRIQGGAGGRKTSFDTGCLKLHCLYQETRGFQMGRWGKVGGWSWGTSDCALIIIRVVFLNHQDSLALTSLTR